MRTVHSMCDLEGSEMKKQWKAAAVVAAIALGVVGGKAFAESGYGYNDTGAAGAVTARATIKITLNTPKMILLRVGASNAQDNLTFNLTPTMATTPTTPVNGNNQAA